MTRSRWGAARLATLLLLAMVGVAGEAMPAPPVPPTNHTVEEDYEYYYDYDYYYDDDGFKLNMSEFRLPKEQRRVGEPYVPRYMLELYAEQSFSRKTPLPGADLVRSFTAVSTERDGEPDEDGRRARRHTLGFNVTAPRGETITNATLRLYALITRDQYSYIGVERRVRVEMTVPSDDAPHHRHTAESNLVTVKVCEKDIYELHNAWETFDVTFAVRHWLAHPSRPQLLQIYVESVFSTAGSGGEMDVATMPLTDSEPLLLVYSSVRHRKQSRHELSVMISHENDIQKKLEHRRKRRSLERLHRARIRRNTAEIQEEESNMIWEGELEVPDLPQHAHNSLGDRGRGRRGRRRRAKNGCKRKPLRVDFRDIGWDDWIIAPVSYEAYQCTGKCFYPLSSHLTPTKHAVVQTLMNSVHPERSPRACCVPTKLKSISLLYFENNNTPTFKYNFDDMVVLECGCR